VAAEQDRTVQQPKRDIDEGPRSSEEKASFKGEREESGGNEEKSSPANEDGKKAVAFDSSTTSVKLRREAAWQEQLGHGDAARELRRELDWHRANWNQGSVKGQSDSKQGDGNAKAPRNKDWGERPSKPKTDSRDANKKVEDVNELERFWIALCRHLWNHGY
jgi:hypothetical protein